MDDEQLTSQPEETDVITARRAFSAEDVYHMLRRDIMSLNIRPGDMISENEISERFGISRTPVRSVIERLRRENLVVVAPRKGTYVSLVDLDFAEQIIFMRIQAEAAVMEGIIRHPSAALFARLDENLREQQELIKKEGIDDAFYRVDSRFHETCMAYRGKLKLWQVIQNMDQHYSRYRRFDYITSSKFTPVYHTLFQEHTRLLELMRAGEAGQIRLALTTHLYGGILRIGTRLQDEYGDYMADTTRSIQDIITDINFAIQEAQEAAMSPLDKPRRRRGRLTPSG